MNLWGGEGAACEWHAELLVQGLSVTAHKVKIELYIVGSTGCFFLSITSISDIRATESYVDAVCRMEKLWLTNWR